MADKRLDNMRDKITKTKDMLYSDIYYNDNLASEEIKRLKNRVNDAIEKISNNNIASTGVSNISVLYTKAANIANKNNSDLVAELNKALSDRNTMNNLFAIYTQNTMVRDLDKEIDMVCKYMPKLEDALDTRREYVLSADHFSKNTISIKSSKGTDTQNPSIQNNIETLKKKYELDDLLENDIYKPMDKYGEAFVYIVPYKKAIQTLLQAQYMTNNGQSNPDFINSPTGVTEAALDDISRNNTEEIPIAGIIHESLDGFDDMTKRMKYSEKQKQEERKIIESMSDIKIEINRSRVIESAVRDRARTMRIFNENGSLFFNEDKSTSIFGDGTFKDKFTSATADPNSMSADGVTLLNGQKPLKNNAIKIPGCIVKILDHDMVKPLYIDNICLGYFYIECDKKMALEQNNYSTLGGIRPGGVYKGTFDFYRNTSNEYGAIKQIANMISQKIDAAFVNANQDLSREIYAILKYNTTVDATGRVSRIKITFIPPEDIEHCYFEMDKNTNRGISGLSRALFPAKLYSCLYISNTILSLTRGFDKRIFYVRQTVDTNIAGVLMNVINQIQKANYNIRQIESMGNVLNMIGRFNDLVIPRSSSGDAPVEFEVMPGQQIEVKSDLMNMLEELAVNATDVPLELIQMRNSPEYATHLTMTNTKFLQKVYNKQSKTQKIFSRIITKIYNYEFNDDTDNHDEITVELPPPLYLAATNTGQIASAIVDVSNLAAAAYVDENDAAKTGAVRRRFQQEMMGSLFPTGMMERVINAAELDLAKESDTEETGEQ
ncbi:MAG: hypothetical protein IJ880_01975 [Bacilli bacterium]|nr:hypothetical protein [Bacilli bacterium]